MKVESSKSKEAVLRCVICQQGETAPGLVTVTLERGLSTLVFKSVPALVCENCGEAYVSDDVAARLLEIANRAVSAGVQVEIRAYEAA